MWLSQTASPLCAEVTNKAPTGTSLVAYGRASACCEINALGEQIGQADQKKDDKQAEALSQQVIELEKRDINRSRPRASLRAAR